MAEPSAWPPRTRDPMARPLLWRLPLVLFVALGLVGLFRVDALLRRDTERDAERFAEQLQSLVATHLRDRASGLHALSIALAAMGESAGRAPRFLPLARELLGAAPEVATVSLLDTAGKVRDRLVRRQARREREVPYGGRLERAVAVAAALRSGRMTATPTITLSDGSSGIVLYDPIGAGGAGLVSAGIAHDRLFGRVLAPHLGDRFGYRLRDEVGTTITRHARWAEGGAGTVSRAVELPDGRRWTIDVAVPRAEPFLPRLLSALGGVLLIALVVVSVLREAARSERLREHSLQLELLSRDLLDANVRLEERAGQVAEANRAKSRFLANVSHELRTPINAIVGYNALALDGVYGALPAPMQGAHERIRLASRHLQALVDDVLDLSRIEVGRMALDPVAVDLGAVLRGVAAIVEPTAAAKGLHVDVVLGRDLPRLTTDVRHLKRILLNLTSNAVKFTERGVVTLVARRDPAAPGERVSIAVEDTGVGIAPADQQRIFEEFEQVLVEPGAAARGDSLRRGTGLGLAVVRKLARLLGGDVQVESAPGLGSRFTLVIPIDAPRRAGVDGVDAPPAHD